MTAEAADPRPAKPGRLYRKLSVSMWGDERFCRLSKPRPNAQTLMIYLLCGPHTSVLPGLWVIGQAALAEALGWPLSAFRKCFAELVAAGIAKADWAARVVWLPKAARHNPPDNPNVVKSWRKALDIIPECELKREANAALLAFLQQFGEPFAQPFAQPFAEPYAKQEQYQEQYQDQKQYQDQEQNQDPHVSPLSRHESRSLLAEGFADFWEAYPNKKAKGEAEKAWKTLKPNADLRQTILSAIATQRRSEDWKNEDGRYIPHPATWLRAKQWEDVPRRLGRQPSGERIDPPSVEETLKLMESWKR